LAFGSVLGNQYQSKRMQAVTHSADHDGSCACPGKGEAHMILIYTALTIMSMGSKHFVDMEYTGSYAYPVQVFCLDDMEASAILGNDLRCFSTN
jgi:hypothetical protein